MINQRLVTVRSIDEMQKRNAELLQVIKDLTIEKDQQERDSINRVRELKKDGGKK